MLNRRFFISFCAVVSVLVIALMSISDKAESKPTKKVAIYECMEITSSLDELKDHLKGHCDLIDQFVILECMEDEKGNCKDLLYPTFKSELQDFSDKIIYIAAPSLAQTNQQAVKEFYYKNQYLKAFDECQNQDVIIFSQVNNILTPSDLHQALIKLERRPEEILLLKGNKEASALKLATYEHVKQVLPATIEKSSKLNAQALDWKAFFYPIKESL
ncbi:MAG: hypothetical protein S4CHLAM6_13110 [Chlamydiae bacterium]|nr:hypothetical protein [Chlamydiota bacterium]